MRIFKFFLLFSFVLAGCSAANFISAANPPKVVINEIAWMGTDISPNDEWIELYNNTDSSIKFNEWHLIAADGSPKISLLGIIPPNGFYLLERTDDNSVPKVPASRVYTGALKNSGENLELYDNLGNLIDSVSCSSGWFAGDNKTKQTMERKNSKSPGSHLEDWQTSQNPGGTPNIENSIIIEAVSQETILELKTEPQSLKGSQIEESVTQEQSSEKSSISPLVLLVSVVVAIFSGAMILILQKKIKKEYNKEV